MGDDFGLHRARRGLFGADVQSYAAGRPGYPDRVFEILVERCGLTAGCEVVEIGAGTGQATGVLLDFGARVTVVDLDPELTAHLQTRFAGEPLQVVCAPFEEAALPRDGFDLVVAATSFHWVPTALGLARAADALRPGGSLALWWTVFGDRNRPDPFHEALVPVLERLAPELVDAPSSGNPGTGAPPYALDAEARIADLDSSHRFGPVHHELIEWTGRHTPEQIRALFGSFSPWLALPPDQRTTVLDALEALAREEFAGVVERPYLTPVYVASRVV